MTHSISRRDFLKTTALTAPITTLVDSCGLSRSVESDAATPVFFTAAALAFVDGATSRLIPTDELGPGGRETNVSGFIDLQLESADRFD